MICGSGTSRAALAGLVVAALVVAPRSALAQAQARLDLGGFVEVGGEAERYLRALQISGLAPLTAWSIQPFSPTQATLLRAKGAHPWRARFDSANSAANTLPGVRALRLDGRLITNSTFPVQTGGGPVWAGRGVTGVLQGGVSAVWGRVYAQAAPVAFAAQNAGFALAPNGVTGDARFRDARFPFIIDAPQRFGTGGYTRLTPGSSSLLLDYSPVVLGVTTAPQRWGPARDYPLVLGPNPGGFPSAYIGTSKPFDLWLFQAHVRAVYARLGQSAYSPVADSDRTRLGTGAVIAITPRGVPGLEIGASRFIHQPWTGNLTRSSLTRPIFGGLNLFGVTENRGPENQVASFFARWALPAAKAEFYGEMYREDFPGHFHEALSLIEKPDDLAAFTIGFQQVLKSGDAEIRVLRAELVNGQTSHQERNERGFTEPLPPYIHTRVNQGHTVNGFLLGSPEAYGGAAWRVGMDQFTPQGRASVTLERTMRFDWLPTAARDGALVHPDIVYALRGELLRFNGGMEWGVIVIPAVDLNRNLIAGHDVLNLTAGLTVRGWP